jgi:flagellar biogenesis protein FliO
LIRRPDGAAPATRPAAPQGGTGAAGAGDAGVQSVAPSLGLSKVAGALAIVLTLIFALRHVMKRAFGVAGAGASSRAVVVLSRTVLAPRQQVMLLHVGRRLIVVGDSGGQMSTLSEITDPDEVAALVGQLRDEKLSSAAPAFGGLLGRLRAGTESGSSSFDTNTGDTNTGQHAATIDERDDRTDGDQNGDDPETGPTRQEINGLLAKVRLLSHQFKGT